MDDEHTNILLAIDNSLTALTIVLSQADRIIEERHIQGSRPPSEIIASSVSHILSDHSYTINDVTTLIVTVGPGSFTGIRVALAFCKGIRAGTHIALRGVPTLDALAFPFRSMEGYYLAPLIDAKKGEVFFCLYEVQQNTLLRLTEYKAIKPEALIQYVKKPCVIVGNGAVLCERFVVDHEGFIIITQGFNQVSGEALIRCGIERIKKNEPALCEPIYARPSEAEIKYGITIH